MKHKIQKTAHALAVAMAMPLVSIALTGCESMSPEGSAALDGGAPKTRPAATGAAATGPAASRLPHAAAPASRPYHPFDEPVHPSELPSAPDLQSVPIPEPVPR